MNCEFIGYHERHYNAKTGGVCDEPAVGVMSYADSRLRINGCSACLANWCPNCTVYETCAIHAAVYTINELSSL